MASIFGSGSVAEPRSGGKIVRDRRTVVRKTPYDRPRLPMSDPQSPNWVSRYIISPTRSIASGAGKLLSFVLDRESSSSSSSSDSSTFDDNSCSEDEIDTEDQENVENGQDDTTLNRKKRTLEAANHLRKEEPSQSYSETKSAIEQLLMQETFSREECNRLVKIIRSRVVGNTTNMAAADKRTGTSTPDLCTKAVMEARKWLHERKSRSESRLDPGDATYSWKFNIPPEVVGDAGSPADVAKTYMQTRPPWASPVDHISSPSSIGIQLFREETPYSTSGKPVLFSKRKKDSSSTGSWNIQYEIRRVRSRATEEMLRNVPFSKLDYSVPALEYKNSTGASAAERLDIKGKKVQNTKDVRDATLNLTAEQNDLTFTDLKRKEDQMTNEATFTTASIADPGKSQDLVTVQASKGLSDNREKTSSGKKFGSSDELKILLHRDGNLSNANAANISNGTTEPLNPIANKVVEGPRVNDGNCPTPKLMGAEGAAANGCPPSVSSLSTGQLVEQTKIACHEDQSLGSKHDKMDKVIPQAREDICELMTETLMESPDGNVNSNVAVYGDDGAVSGSQNSSSVPYVELQQISEPNVATKTSTAERQRGKRLSKYNRRGKGRGK